MSSFSVKMSTREIAELQMAVDHLQAELLNLTRDIPKMNTTLGELKTNTDVFFMMVMAIIIYCKYLLQVN